jgi:GntR family transcriptional regulator
MDLVISPTSGKPIYEQLEEQIKNLIITRKLQPGDPLPSMRDLARDLGISLITTKRTYKDLEEQGFIISMVGKGSFVSENNLEFLSEYKYREVEQSLRKAVEQSRMCDISLEDMIEVLRMLYEEGADERDYRGQGPQEIIQGFHARSHRYGDTEGSRDRCAGE